MTKPNRKKKLKRGYCRNCGCEMTIREDRIGGGLCYVCAAPDPAREERERELMFPRHA